LLSLDDDDDGGCGDVSQMYHSCSSAQARLCYVDFVFQLLTNPCYSVQWFIRSVHVGVHFYVCVCVFGKAFACALDCFVIKVVCDGALEGRVFGRIDSQPARQIE
jgi:hypothetical protein